MNSFMDAKTLLFVGLGAMLVIYSVTVFRGGLVMPTALQSARWVGSGIGVSDMGRARIVPEPERCRTRQRGGSA